jgi:hypothetical protein
VEKSWRMRRFWRRGAKPDPDTLPTDFEALTQFLGGELLDQFSGDLASAPDWVWVSVLAHASEEYLAALASTGPLPQPTARCLWDRTLSFLSEMVLDHARRTGVPVATLQREIIVPIELQLGPNRPLAPSTFVRLVVTGLHEHLGPQAEQPSPSTDGRS